MILRWVFIRRIESTKLFHNAKAFDVKENQNTVVELYAATDTNHLAIYGTPAKDMDMGIMAPT